jgi:hypothetical protein
MRFVQTIDEAMDGQIGRAIAETRAVVAEGYDGRFEILRWLGEISGGGQAPALNEERTA